MSEPRILSDYDYRWATRAPLECGVVVEPQRKLPTMLKPPCEVLVTDPSDDVLVDVKHRKVRNLSVYWHSGWPAAASRTLVRSEVAERLYAAADALPEPFGLATFDAYRPLDLQQAIFDAAYADPTLPAGFVSVPSSDPSTPPPHLTGGTVDVTLTWRGTPLSLGTEFDDFSDIARTDALESIDSTERSLRRLLFWTMRSSGFVVIDCEWWHFEYGTRRWAEINGVAPLFGPATPVL